MPKRSSKPQSAPTRPRPTKAEFASALGISPRQVQNHFAAGCPRTSIAAARRWRAENIRLGEKRSGSKRGRAEIIALGIAKLFEEVRGSKLANQIAEGNTIPLAEAERFLSEMNLRIKSRLEAIPDELEMGFPPDQRIEAKRKLQDAIRALLHEMADPNFLRKPLPKVRKSRKKK